MATPGTVDAYLDAQPADRRAVLEEMRRTIRAAAPDALESIAYSMPAFRTRDGQFLVSYAAYKGHYSLFPANEGIVAALGDEVAPYVAGKGTLRFPITAPLPMALVAKVVGVRLAQNAARARA